MVRSPARYYNAAGTISSRGGRSDKPQPDGSEDYGAVQKLRVGPRAAISSRRNENCPGYVGFSTYTSKKHDKLQSTYLIPGLM